MREGPNFVALLGRAVAVAYKVDTCSRRAQHADDKVTATGSRTHQKCAFCEA